MLAPLSLTHQQHRQSFKRKILEWGFRFTAQSLWNASLLLGLLFFGMLNHNAAMGEGNSYPEVDFDNLSLPDSPNYHLYSPKAEEASEHIDKSPIFSLPADSLETKFINFLQKQSRMHYFEKDSTSEVHAMVQKTKIMGFPDFIYFKVEPIDEKSSTFFLFSRSKYGYYDFGANKSRLRGYILEFKKSNDL